MTEWIDEQFASIELVEDDVFKNFESIDIMYKNCMDKILNNSFDEEDRKRNISYAFQKQKDMIVTNGGFEQYFEYCEAIEMKRALAAFCNTEDSDDILKTR